LDRFQVRKIGLAVQRQMAAKFGGELSECGVDGESSCPHFENCTARWNDDNLPRCAIRGVVSWFRIWAGGAL